MSSSARLLRRARRDRGATLVEYALMLCLVAVICTTAVRGLGNKSSSTLDAAHAGISGAAASTTTGSGGPGDDGGGGGGATTTAAPTSTVAPTSAATAPAAPATTVPPTPDLLSIGASFTGMSTSTSSSSNWTASTTVIVKTTGGIGVPGATVTLKVRTLVGSTWSEQTASVTTAANGKVTYTTPDLERNNPNPVTKVEIVVTDVSVPTGFTFDGIKPSTSADKP